MSRRSYRPYTANQRAASGDVAVIGVLVFVLALVSYFINIPVTVLLDTNPFVSWAVLFVITAIGYGVLSWRLKD